jgi:hypothetical protein
LCEINFAGEESKQRVANADMPDGVKDTDTACRETAELGKEVLTGTDGTNQQLTASTEGPVTAGEMVASSKVSTGTCLLRYVVQ